MKQNINHKEYIKLVNEENFPTDPIVPLDDPFTDHRGYIQNLLLRPMGVAIISSKAGTIRSNHYHQTDYHYLYVISGSMLYYERSIDESGDGIVPITMHAGEMIFTAPHKVHKTEFIQDTILLSISKNPRDHQSHESDVIRITF